ncbi:MAG TPA: ABC transporter permease [Egibacteraceae bacterium]|jgi:ABC-type dipeptide/oligopeptide/nickel transport system permease subunit|nr:ABC transporter permease [Egibacteraceae bacterium]
MTETSTRDVRAEALAREGLEVVPVTQLQLFRRRFLQHRLAMASLVILAVIFLAALNAERVAPYGFGELDLRNASQPPTFENLHFFGTDRLGRDYFSRVLHGTRTSVIVAGIVALLSTVIGTVIGAVAGYFGGWVDNLLMRLTDLVLVVPGLAALLVLVAFLGHGSPYRVAVILATLLWTLVARIVRGSFLSLREKEFVEAAKASGARDTRIIFRHILPNALGPIIVNATLTVALAILLEAALSFLGFGVQPPNPALGKLISDGRGTMLTQWWLVTMPGLTIVVICLAINFVGDGLRDALDPQQRR